MSGTAEDGIYEALWEQTESNTDADFDPHRALEHTGCSIRTT